MEKSLLNATLLKKYHHYLVYDYTEYPTKGNWDHNFGSEDYKKSLDLSGWNTIDAYSNEVIFLFRNIKTNISIKNEDKYDPKGPSIFELTSILES